MTIALNENPEPMFPKDLLSAGYVSQTWFVAQVKSRREKALADFLFRRSIGYYLPLIQKRQSSVKRVRYSLVPIFPGYVFVNTNEAGRYTALTSNHIGRIIEVSDSERLLRELDRVNRVLSADMPVYPVDFLNVGQRVRVKKGPMKDVEGIIIRKNKQFRLVLTVTSIMQSISMEIDADIVEPL